MRKEYRHMMEQAALSDEKKEEILTMLEYQDTKKRRMPKVTKIVLAAALAVGCVLSIAAGLPAQVYNFVSGGQTVVQPGTGDTSFTLNGDVAGPVSVENGRLMCTADGRKLDITDKVDENTPYILERTDPNTKQKGYVVAGGTVDNFGWAEFFLAEDGTCSMAGENAWDYMVPVDGKQIPMSELTDAQREMLNKDGGQLMETVNRPWLDKALEQLDLKVELGLAD